MDNQIVELKTNPDLSKPSIDIQKSEKVQAKKKEDVQLREKDQFIPSNELKSDIKRAKISPSESFNQKRETIKNQVEFFFNTIKK